MSHQERLYMHHVCYKCFISLIKDYHDITVTVHIHSEELKGNEALGKFFFFFSKARKYGEEIKIKKKIKIPLFPASQTTFWK